VFGVEGDYQWSGQKKTQTFGCGVGCTLSETYSVDSFGTARARVGAAFDRVLVYATGGAAWTSATDALNASAGGVTVNLLSVSGNKVGWTIGGGIEAALIDNWSAKIEYLYISTSNSVGSAAVPAILGGGTITETAQLKDSIIRFGINYRFPIGGAVVAKY
jgi:outer membrane immunogenic protein